MWTTKFMIFIIILQSCVYATCVCFYIKNEETLFHQRNIWNIFSNANHDTQRIPFLRSFLFLNVCSSPSGIFFKMSLSDTNIIVNINSKPVRRFWSVLQLLYAFESTEEEKKHWLFVVCFVFQWLFVLKLKVISIKWSCSAFI